MTPVVSAEPKSGLAVSQDGVLIENLTAPLDAVTRYSNDFGESGPPGEPETTNPVAGVTTKVGDPWFCAHAVDDTQAAANVQAIQEIIGDRTFPDRRRCLARRNSGYYPLPLSAKAFEADIALLRPTLAAAHRRIDTVTASTAPQ